jgi:hypothetical protein
MDLDYPDLRLSCIQSVPWGELQDTTASPEFCTIWPYTVGGTDLFLSNVWRLLTMLSHKVSEIWGSEDCEDCEDCEDVDSGSEGHWYLHDYTAPHTY